MTISQQYYQENSLNCYEGSGNGRLAKGMANLELRKSGKERKIK
jgi:hypothetical protein